MEISWSKIFVDYKGKNKNFILIDNNFTVYKLKYITYQVTYLICDRKNDYYLFIIKVE